MTLRNVFILQKLCFLLYQLCSSLLIHHLTIRRYSIRAADGVAEKTTDEFTIMSNLRLINL